MKKFEITYTMKKTFTIPDTATDEEYDAARDMVVEGIKTDGGTDISVQLVDAPEEIKQKYNLKSVKNFSSHSLRKSFGRHVYERADTNAEMALALLSELFNHSSISITKRYLGIRHEELMGCYDLLSF